MHGGTPSRALDWRIMGAILVAVGGVALAEGVRLYRLREALVAGAVVGDDTFPLIVGAALVVLGLYLLGATPASPVRADWPAGAVRARMLGGAGLLVLYWLIVPWIGYTASTGLVSVALFRTMGGYGWPAAALLGGATTGGLYLLFRVWLLQPLPSGLLGG